MKIALFIDYQFFGFAPDAASMLDAMCKHQFHNARLGDEEKVFTVLSPEREYAFSQRYKKLPDVTCRHGTMWKHEKGLDNPDSPNYDTLVSRIPAISV